MSVRSTRRTSTVEELLRCLDILRDFTARSSFMRHLFLSYTRLFLMWAMCLPGIMYTLYFISVYTSEELYSPFHINIKIHMKLLFIALFAPTVLPISPARFDESYSVFKVRFLSWWQIMWYNSCSCELTIYILLVLSFYLLKKIVKTYISMYRKEKDKLKFEIFLILNKLLETEKNSFKRWCYFSYICFYDIYFFQS